MANLFYSVGVLYITSSRAVPTSVAGFVKRMIRLLLAEISGCFLPVVHSVCAGLLWGFARHAARIGSFISEQPDLYLTTR